MFLLLFYCLHKNALKRNREHIEQIELLGSLRSEHCIKVSIMFSIYLLYNLYAALPHSTNKNDNDYYCVSSKSPSISKRMSFLVLLSIVRCTCLYIYGVTCWFIQTRVNALWSYCAICIICAEAKLTHCCLLRYT